MTAQHHFLDRPVARILAAAIFVAAIGLLGFIHRRDLFPMAPQAITDDPYAKCVSARQADLDKMLSDRVISEEQAALFKGRAEALCRAQTQDPKRGGDALPPGLRPAPSR